MLNFPKLCELTHFFKLLFRAVVQLFFMKHVDEPLYLGKNVLYFYVTITYLHFLWHINKG